MAAIGGGSDYRYLRVAHEAGVAWIVLDRPNEGNALSQALADEFVRAVDGAVDDPSVRVVVLSGNGPFFCAGGDVVGMADADDPVAFTGHLARTMHRGILALARSELLVIAAVNGAVAGAGVGLVLNAQLVIASSAASFVSAYAGIGVSPDCGVSYLLPRAVGDVRAAALLFGGRPIDAATAESWGLVGEVTDVAGFDEHVRATVERLARGASQAYGPTKRLAMAPWIAAYEEHLEAEAASIATLVGHPDSQARVRKFVAASRERAAAKAETMR
ncbi:enoyl-CoA hydratase/isomerase family protein [Georgenia ruanii]|uniref:Enoyl-CoA hydratase/isomerase family protein n=1 Tax=Georgenia ruanii TaxID=348442 RepID=A0A7J9UXS1_9MICO|nr:enoyl-CoA hydratase/isomerase family protein [Georgenia ruanii]MPV88484.1 enoyl-CoA hydratase/isomerase family protein [Georgenia ruanii]